MRLNLFHVHRSVAVNEVNREMKKTRRDLSSHKEECDSSVAKVKVETEQLAAALLHIRQSLKQSLEEQIFRVDMQIAEESKKVEKIHFNVSHFFQNDTRKCPPNCAKSCRKQSRTVLRRL